MMGKRVSDSELIDMKPPKPVGSRVSRAGRLLRNLGLTGGSKLSKGDIALLTGTCSDALSLRPHRDPTIKVYLVEK